MDRDPDRPATLLDRDRLRRLASALLGVGDWAGLTAAVADAFEGDVRTRLWTIGDDDVTERARHPADAVLPGRPSRQIARLGEQREISRDADGGTLLPLRAVGVPPMVLEVHGVDDGRWDYVEDVGRVVASRAAYLALTDHAVRIPALGRDGEEAARAVRGFSSSMQSVLVHDRLTVYVLTAAARAVERFAVAGLAPSPDEERISPLLEFDWPDCLLRGRPVLTTDLGEEGPRRRHTELLLRSGFRSAMGVPLRVDGRPLGMLQLLSRSSGFYGPPDLRIAVGVGNHFAPFVDYLRRQVIAQAAAVHHVVEAERTRLARVLDLGAGQTLAQAEIVLAELAADPTGDPAGSSAARATVARLVGTARVELGAAIADTAPPDLRSRSFDSALRATARAYGTDRGVRTRVVFTGDVTRAALSARHLAYEVVRLALISAGSAGAVEASVELTVLDDLELSVTCGSPPRDRPVADRRPPDRPHSPPVFTADPDATAEWVRALGGRLVSDRGPAGGTCTTLTLPLVRSPGTYPDVAAPRGGDGGNGGGDGDEGGSSLLRIFVLDPQGMRRAGTAHVLDGQRGLRVVGEGTTVADARGSLGWLRPDVVLVDADDPTAVETSREVRAATATSVVVGLTGRSGTGPSSALAAAGVASVLPLDLPPAELGDALRRAAGGAVEGSGAASTPGADAALLTPREQAVLDLVVAGHTNTEIGTALFLAAKSIERHIATVTRKIGARNRAHLVSLAIGRGLVSPATD